MALALAPPSHIPNDLVPSISPIYPHRARRVQSGESDPPLVRACACTHVYDRCRPATPRCRPFGDTLALHALSSLPRSLPAARALSPCADDEQAPVVRHVVHKRRAPGGRVRAGTGRADGKIDRRAEGRSDRRTDGRVTRKVTRIIRGRTGRTGAARAPQDRARP